MEDVFYDTSWTIYAVTETTKPLRALFSASPATLDTNALKLRDHLSTGRAKYEDEEEQEKIGGLRESQWDHLRQEGSTPHGLSITLTYDKTTYTFLLYSSSSQALRSPLLLVKATASLTSRFLTFLILHFQAPIVVPLRLPPSHLPNTLSRYLTSLTTAHRPIATDHALLDFLRDTVGAIKLTISITDPAIAKDLRTIEVDVPPETLYQLLPSSESAAGEADFLTSLSTHLRNRTGLILPLSTSTTPPASNDSHTNGTDAETKPAPLKLSRITTAAFALSSEGRLKLSMRAVQVVDAVPGLDRGEENVVRVANAEIIERLCEEARTMAEDSNDYDDG